MKKIMLILANSLLILNVHLCFGLLTPKYLSVPHWRSCVNKISQGAARFVCLPASKPSKCPDKTWKSLKDNELIDKC